MENVTNELQVRIAWCQLQRTRAVTLDEEEDWRAEESGLLDALHGVDRTERWGNSYPSRVKRYQVGLLDGLALQGRSGACARAATANMNQRREWAKSPPRNRPAGRTLQQGLPPAPDVSGGLDDVLSTMWRTAG